MMTMIWTTVVVAMLSTKQRRLRYLRDVCLLRERAMWLDLLVRAGRQKPRRRRQLPMMAKIWTAAVAMLSTKRRRQQRCLHGGCLLLEHAMRQGLLVRVGRL